MSGPVTVSEFKGYWCQSQSTVYRVYLITRQHSLLTSFAFPGRHLVVLDDVDGVLGDAVSVGVGQGAPEEDAAADLAAEDVAVAALAPLHEDLQRLELQHPRVDAGRRRSGLGRIIWCCLWGMTSLLSTIQLSVGC